MCVTNNIVLLYSYYQKIDKKKMKKSFPGFHQIKYYDIPILYILSTK